MHWLATVAYPCGAQAGGQPCYPLGGYGIPSQQTLVSPERDLHCISQNSDESSFSQGDESPGRVMSPVLPRLRGSHSTVQGVIRQSLTRRREPAVLLLVGSHLVRLGRKVRGLPVLADPQGRVQPGGTANAG